MDKPSHSHLSSAGRGGKGNNNNSSSTDQYLTHLNRISHKISKPLRPTAPSPDHSLKYLHRRSPPPPPQPPPPPPPPNLQQPPVYNINKNEFRDLVQKLTGSPAHDRFTTPSPINPPKPQSSRLQRIRPPPLSGVSNRPPQPWRPAAMAAPSCAAPPPFSPLPPFPSVNGAAESPISAYMRYLQSSISAIDADSKQFSRSFSLISPRNSHSSMQQNIQMQIQTSAAVSASLPQFIIPSPRSSYPLVSPRLLISPTSGQLGFPQIPLSPILPFSSPRWRGL